MSQDIIQSAGRLDGARISVIIPCYNSGDIVPAAIRSVLSQSRPPDEVIVVDDGSKDPDSIARACAEFGDAVRYIHRENGGASSARNTGIEASSGDWLAFLDADDWWDPEKLELQVRALEENPEADFAITSALAWSPQDDSYHLFRWNGSLDPNELRAQLLVRNIFSGLCSSILVRRDALKDVGGFAGGKACEDRRLAIALLDRYRALILDLPLVRQCPGPAHWTNPERHRCEMLSLIADHEELYARLDPTGRLRRHALARMYERSGMHYLDNGDFPTAKRDLRQALRLQPLMANPWRAFINMRLGRLRPAGGERPAPQGVKGR